MARRLEKQMAQRRLSSRRGIARNTQLRGDLVRGPESHAREGLDQAIGVLAQRADGLLAVLTVDPRGEGGTDLELLEEEQRFELGAMLLECLLDLARTGFPNAFDGRKATGVGHDLLQRVDPQGFDDTLAEALSDPCDGARSEVARHAQTGSRQDGKSTLDAELPAISRVIQELARGLDLFSLADSGRTRRPSVSTPPASRPQLRDRVRTVPPPGR